MFLLSKALMWKPGASGATTRKILFLDASRAHCQAEATSEMAIKLFLEEQVKGEDLIGDLLKSLYGTRKAAHNWEKVATSDRRQWFCHRYMVTRMCRRERELCGSVHGGDDFTIMGDSMQLA